MARRILGPMLAALTLGAALALPGSAAGDGAPPAPFTSYGVSPPHQADYTATPSGHGTTAVRKYQNGTSTSKNLEGRFAIPAVTIRGEPGGLSADGRTLVLVAVRKDVTDAPTHVLVLDTRDLSVRQRLTLRGAFTFDALSPDGSAIYFIQYLSPRDQTKYAVREYNVQQGRLLPNPIVDPNEHADEMRGYPLQRIMSTNGRWAYTLYDGGDGEPFVHALDTAKGRAVCVDLDGLVTASGVRGVQIARSPDGNRLTLTRDKVPLAVIDTRKLEASAPTAPAKASSHGDGVPWVLIAIAAALGLAAGGAFIATRHRRTSRLAARDA